MNNNWLKYLVALAAIMIAGSAAYFSVTGLGVLFSGAAIAVMVMAGSLEFAKLVTATYLKQKWSEIGTLNKWYLTSAVAILMLITSAGIFGYLSNAFQQQNLKLQQVDREVLVHSTKIQQNEKQITQLSTQITESNNNQGKILDNGKVNSRLLRSVDNRDKQIGKLNDRIAKLQQENAAENDSINKIKTDNIGIEKEVGGFRFVAEAFGVELKTVVKFFIILIVIVFDPLAVALIIALNQLVITKRKDEDDVEVKEEPTKIDASDLIGEVSKIRLSEDDLKKLEEVLLNPPPPNDALKKAADEYNRRGEILAEMMKNDQELGLYDEPSDNPMNKENLPQEVINAREALENITFLEEDDISDWDGTLMDGLEDEEPFFTEEELEKLKEIDNNLTEQEEEYDEHILQYEPTLEEEKQNFSTMEPNPTDFLQNNEDGWTEEMEQRYWDEQVPEPFATPEELEKFGIDVQVSDNTSSSDDEKKK